ncbi:hypothetical protein N1851_028985 [Merluccius polli]|uniref:Uncharacterized protein n=1 Tax=Merluccius polli TaxID=89951 RepID=A0AA47M7P5_MERPO|nr:hypothetical protein N1851_028985 [Merluccius polli]
MWTQIYLPVRPGDPNSLAAALDCLKDIQNSGLGPMSSNLKPAARYLGVMFVIDLSFEPHITKAFHSLAFLLLFLSKIDFKILLINFKACRRQGLAPSYIIYMLAHYEPVGSLRSSGGGLLAVPKSRLKSKGSPLDLQLTAPRLCNALPEDIRLV